MHKRTIQTRDGPTVMVVHKNDGLTKRCDHPRSQWARCPDPWHFAFSRAGRLHRHSLHTLMDKPSSYAMSKTEAEAIRDRVRHLSREGTFTVTRDGRLAPRTRPMRQRPARG